MSKQRAQPTGLAKKPRKNDGCLRAAAFGTARSHARAGMAGPKPNLLLSSSDGMPAPHRRRIRIRSLKHALIAAFIGMAAAPSDALSETAPFPAARGYAQAVERAAPAVVDIFADAQVRSTVFNYWFDPDFFGRPSAQLRRSQGSGMIVGQDGLVATNLHVVRGSDSITTVLNDRREYQAEIVFRSERFDIALLKLDGASELPVAEFRGSNELAVGEPALAIGNPFGMGQVASSGIISGFFNHGSRGIFVQTDAPIHSGNSGGALTDSDGRVIGMVTKVALDDQGWRGIGFAIASELILAALEQYRQGRNEFQVPWLGISTQELGMDLAIASGLTKPEGVMVTAVHGASPFAATGNRRGDILVEIDGREINSKGELEFWAAAAGLGRKIPFAFYRRGTREVSYLDTRLPPETPSRDDGPVGGIGPFRDFHVSNVNPAVASEMQLDMFTEGVVVTLVPDYLRRSGIRAGDLIRELNGREVRSARDLRRIAEDQLDAWSIVIERNGELSAFRIRL